MINLEEFLSNIDLECDSEDDIIPIKAFQLDNKRSGSFGLKHKLKVESIKSCDYFLEKDEKILIIEISNFFKQLENLKSTYNKLKKVKNLNREDKDLIREFLFPEIVMKNEAKNKYLNTLLLLSYFNLATVKKRKKIFILAYCVDGYSVAQVLDRIERNLKNELQVLVDDIKVIPAREIERLSEKF